MLNPNNTRKSLQVSIPLSLYIAKEEQQGKGFWKLV